VKYFDWDEEKNQWLMRERGISFEMIVIALEQNQVVMIVPNKHPRTHQKKYIVKIDDYIYVVPFVEDDYKIFFKTIYPSHEETKKYLKNIHDKK
jgi:uncharacterized DUF497 family protein